MYLQELRLKNIKLFEELQLTLERDGLPRM